MQVAAAGGVDNPPPSPAPPQKTPESGNGKRPKRKMKTPYQLQVLEETYAVDTYPLEDLRAEVCAKIGLSDRQLQMWFCHRRLKDRKFPPTKRARTEEEVPISPPLPSAQHVVPTSEMALAGSSSSSAFSGSGEVRRAVGWAGSVVSRKEAEMGTGRRYYTSSSMIAMPLMPQSPPHLSVAELRVIAAVEAQLGEPWREDGPILGVEFEPLPAGAFGAPIAMTPHQKQPLRPCNTHLLERHLPKTIKPSTFMPSMEHNYVTSSSGGRRKPAVGGAHVVHPTAGSRALHECQFRPEQPSFRLETHERQTHSHFYDPAAVTPNTRVLSLPSGDRYLHGSEQVSPAYNFQGQLSSTSIPSQQGRHQFFSSGPADYENTSHSRSITNSATGTQLGSEIPYLSSDGRIIRDDDTSRVERKLKSEEARIQKEVEAHEKRIRKELEKQDILRKKREEHMRREMERHGRERKKEEERMLREKQREEERSLREQRRENERRERFLQKETRRAEKMRQKEQQRREKEAEKLKAANERATARKIAREYTDLIEDERIELMEVAAASKGLSSITALDSETLQQLDMFRDMLGAFPPKSVQLKQPFPTLPWTKSEENIANFLMVWKFLITFIDVLGLWSFTIDEFLQSLHDYDSKLLGEIHVSMLKLIIKDIEGVARMPAFALGANQNSAGHPGGGHPQVIEGAYAWGFDICSWQRHLNFLTWPEILRQLALSAGFGPKLKKITVEHPYLRDENEGNGGADVLSTLRNGAAAENAVALMHEKGYPHQRRSRHRLTPGTVKFAAYHILSFEGSKGLTILEVAEKIQKSGLRDLTTSKTPEASIGVALSRDTKLFERTAPSTYRVRSPFRKDPADADAILSAALEKIQVFQNVLSDLEEAEKDVDDVDDAERDEDSDCDFDGAADPEVDNASLNKNAVSSKESVDTKPSISLENKKFAVLRNKGGATSQASLTNTDGGFSACPSVKSNLACGLGAPQSIDIGPRSQATSNVDVEGTEIDESNFGEPWVQGLTEGDYSDLNVEERLSALVALVGVAVEGNSIRVILEERLEAANALKKQMWAEAQLDKRRFKDESTGKVQYFSHMGYKAEASLTNLAEEGSQVPLEIINTKNSDGNPAAVSNDQFLDPQCQNNVNNMSAEKNLSGHEFSTNPGSTSFPQYEYAAEKSKSQLKSYIGHQAEQHYVYRSLPLGQDRRRNRYWLFSTSTSPNEVDSGRVFFESKDGLWRLIDTEEAFDALLSALDTRGVRESHLHSMLQRIESTFKEAIRRSKKHNNLVNPDGSLVKTEAWTSYMASSPDTCTAIDSPSSTLFGLSSCSVGKSASFKIEYGRNEMERNAASKRYKVFLKWMWKECHNPSILRTMKYGKQRCSELLQFCNICYHCYYMEERHCPSCHKTFKPMYSMDAKFSEHVAHCEGKHRMGPDWICGLPDSLPPIGIQLLKAQLSLIEASIPTEALQSFWTDGYRKSWGMKLHSSTTSEDLLQLVTLLEGAVKRDFLSLNFGTTNELLGSSTPGTGNNAAVSGSIPVLPWVPASTAAVALRLLDFDASFSYALHQKLECNKEKEDIDLIKLPTRFTVKIVRELDPTGTQEPVDYQREMRWLDPGSGHRGRRRGTRGRGGGRGRGRGGRGLRGIMTDLAEETVGAYGKTRGGGWPRGRGRKRGCRSARPPQRLVAKEPQLHSFPNGGVSIKQSSFKESPMRSGGNEWGLLQQRTGYVENENSSASQSSGENELLSGNEYDNRINYAVGYGQSKPTRMLDDETEEDEEDVDGCEDEDDGARVGRDMMDVDDEEEEDIGDDEDRQDMGGGDVRRGGEEDSSSSEYSD